MSLTLNLARRNQRMLALLELDDSGVENTFIRQIEEQIGCYHRGFVIIK